MEQGEFLFAAIKHTRETGSFDLPDQNYRKVKDLLTGTTPGFVTAEVRLHDEPSIRMMGKSLFTRGPDYLVQRDKDELEAPSYSGEYVAAVIYCRMNDVPLYFVDLSDSSAQEVALVNITEISKTKPEQIWDESKKIPQDQIAKIWDFEERNKFMAEAIKEVAKKYPGQRGIHIGGADHFNPERSRSTVQDLVGNANIQIIDLRD